MDNNDGLEECRENSKFVFKEYKKKILAWSDISTERGLSSDEFCRRLGAMSAELAINILDMSSSIMLFQFGEKVVRDYIADVYRVHEKCLEKMIENNLDKPSEDVYKKYENVLNFKSRNKGSKK